MGASLATKNRDGSIGSKQTGLIMQDLQNGSGSYVKTPNLNGNFVWARSMEKPGRSMAAGVVVSSGINQINDDLRNKISYYDQGELVKDSLWLTGL
ncbi:hypothetical protein [Pedobacter sp. NJ-S-72]